MAGLRDLDRTLLGDRAPQARTQHAAREAEDQGGERGVARRAHDDAVELGVGVDEGLGGLGAVHLIEAVREAGEVLVGEARGREARRLGLEDPADLVQLEQRGAAEQVADEAEAGQQQLRLEARHVGAVADLRLEHAH